MPSAGDLTPLADGDIVQLPVKFYHRQTGKLECRSYATTGKPEVGLPVHRLGGQTKILGRRARRANFAICRWYFTTGMCNV